MYNIESDMNSGLLVISYNFDINSSTQSINETPYFLLPGDEYILSFTNLQNVKEITKFSYDTLGINDDRYLLQYYRISRDGVSWTDWMDLNRDVDNFPTIDSKDTLNIDIKWVRKGISLIGTIRLLEYRIEGALERNITTNDGTVNILDGEIKIIKVTDIYKVFKITDLEIISSTHPDILTNTNISMMYRYSQDSSRTWSNWEPLTKENITTVNINPIRFFQIEYSIENKTGQNLRVNDINIIGDFQNVTKDYFKSNLFGIRECCQSNLYGTMDANGNFIPNTNLNSSGGGPSCDSGVFTPMTDTDKANLYNPYAQNTAVKLLEKLSADAEQIVGHKVIYFSTDADKKGQDHTLHEYQLYNVVCQGNIKVAIEGNNFPDSQIKMNVFDLDLFESMEAHITKQQFKQIFGVQRRPAKEDFLYFCDLNRMYQVDHAQQFRNFNNSAVYYKLILKKYTQKANVKAATPEIRNQIDKLTNNSTIEQLMGIEQSRDKASIANKQQFTPLTRDPIRVEYFTQIDKELIENSSTIIAKSHYDLASVDYRSTAVSYKNLDPVLKVSDNIGYQIWFNINNYLQGEIYNFFQFYDTNNSFGWKSELSNDTITVTLNDTSYQFNLNNIGDASALEEETWYCYVLNIDQRIRKMEQFIYKRNVEFEEDAANLSNTILDQVYKNSQDITPVSYNIDILSGINPSILGSDMKLTNIRLFSDIIPEGYHNKILNQYIIGDDSKYLVFADNATTRIYLPKFPFNE
jgi:hypothetical protein